jgi:cobyrinic acid a,c-diamide synthase
MAKQKASLQQDDRNKRDKNTVIVPVQVVVPVVAVSTVAASAIAPHRIKDEIKSLLSSVIFSTIAASDVASVAASAIPVIPAVRVIGIVNRTSDMRKLAGSEHQLIVSSPEGRQGILKFADDIVNDYDEDPLQSLRSPKIPFSTLESNYDHIEDY